jgi:hypothetical protein
MTQIGLASAMQSINVDIEIRFGTHNQRIRGTWVGQREGEYLILEIPRKYNWIEVQDAFSTSVSVVVRGVHPQGQVFAASTRFIGTSARPFRTVYVTAPDQFEERSLRKVPRIAVDIDAALSFAREVGPPAGVPEDFSSLRGRVTDLSRTGIAFESVVEPPFSVELFNQRLIDLVMEDEGKQVSRVIGEVKSVRAMNDGLMLFGIAVDMRNKDYERSLGELILSSRTVKAVIKGES